MTRFLALRLTLTALAISALLSACAGGGATEVAGACPAANTSGIANYCVVTKDTLWRGSKPDSAGAAWLIENGVKTIVNLELINDDVSSLVAAKVPAANQYEVAYYRVRNFEPVVALLPSLQDEQIAQFLAIMAKAPKPVYVHCRSGQNRTGVNVAAYRLLVEGASADVVIAEMEKYQGIWFSYDADYIRSIDQTRKVSILAAAAALTTKTTAQSIITCKQGICSAQ
jgi:protein-tyrosine phosphatase